MWPESTNGLPKVKLFQCGRSLREYVECICASPDKRVLLHLCVEVFLVTVSNASEEMYGFSP